MCSVYCGISYIQAWHAMLNSNGGTKQAYGILLFKE